MLLDNSIVALIQSLFPLGREEAEAYNVTNPRRVCGFPYLLKPLEIYVIDPWNKGNVEFFITLCFI